MVERSPRRQVVSSKMYYTYVLKNIKNGKLYTCSTNNLERRLLEHSKGWSKYTRNNGPYKLIYKEFYKSKSEAYRREIFLKTGKGREFIKEMVNSRE